MMIFIDLFILLNSIWDVEKTLDSELSGNVIDLCPVGALTFKPYSFFDRSWELKNIFSIDYSDGLNGKGFNWDNPQASRTCGCGESFAV